MSRNSLTLLLELAKGWREGASGIRVCLVYRCACCCSLRLNLQLQSTDERVEEGGRRVAFLGGNSRFAADLRVWICYTRVAFTP